MIDGEGTVNKDSLFQKELPNLLNNLTSNLLNGENIGKESVDIQAILNKCDK